MHENEMQVEVKCAGIMSVNNNATGKAAGGKRNLGVLLHYNYIIARFYIG